MTSTIDILGPECLFKARFRYDPCRSCTGRDRTCSNYLTVPIRRPKYNHQSLSTKASNGESLQVDHALPAVLYVPLMVRQARYTKILPRNYQDWIRRLNDQGAI